MQHGLVGPTGAGAAAERLVGEPHRSRPVSRPHRRTLPAPQRCRPASGCRCRGAGCRRRHRSCHTGRHRRSKAGRAAAVVPGLCHRQGVGARHAAAGVWRQGGHFDDAISKIVCPLHALGHAGTQCMEASRYVSKSRYHSFLCCQRASRTRTRHSRVRLSGIRTPPVQQTDRSTMWRRHQRIRRSG